MDDVVNVMLLQAGQRVSGCAAGCSSATRGTHIEERLHERLADVVRHVLEHLVHPLDGLDHDEAARVGGRVRLGGAGAMWRGERSNAPLLFCVHGRALVAQDFSVAHDADNKHVAARLGLRAPGA